MPFTAAVVTDLHADLAALTSVLHEAAERAVDEIWCLGDFCSGGPQPSASYDMTMNACDMVLAGNHERFVIERVWEYAPHKRWAAAARAAYDELGDQRVDTLMRMSSVLRVDQAVLVHGSLTGYSDEFLTNVGEARANFALLDVIERNTLLFGHTHRAALWTKRNDDVNSHVPELGKAVLVDSATAALVNPGAVCDRDGARWMTVTFNDDGSRTFTWHQTDVAGHGGVASATPAS